MLHDEMVRIAAGAVFFLLVALVLARRGRR
jgi:hypothetical protein